jgi:putative ubiquitin-RnfH superfamily antitoxin RatB of RatAB toxin-antitoxin module
MAASGSINIEVVFALPDRQKLVSLSIDQACTVKEAILKSGIADEFPDQDIFSCSVGIWGRAVQEDQSLREGDRIEIYRSLLIDPRSARRQLAEHGGFMGRDGQGRQPVKKVGATAKKGQESAR